MKRWAAAFVLALALMLTGCGNQMQTDFPVGGEGVRLLV